MTSPASSAAPERFRLPTPSRRDGPRSSARAGWGWAVRGCVAAAVLLMSLAPGPAAGLPILTATQSGPRALPSPELELLPATTRLFGPTGRVQSDPIPQDDLPEDLYQDQAGLTSGLPATVTDTATVIDTGFVSPVPGPITGAFGRRFHPILHYWRMHYGVDMTAPCGTPVIASLGGTVVWAGWNGGYGNLVVIDHGRYQGRHLLTKYAHLSRVGVRVGQVVARAAGIALSGTTGLSTGCHLHFEVKADGLYVDPAPYLTGKTSPRPTGPIENVGPVSYTHLTLPTSDLV